MMWVHSILYFNPSVQLNLIFLQIKDATFWKVVASFQKKGPVTIGQSLLKQSGIILMVSCTRLYCNML